MFKKIHGVLALAALLAAGGIVLAQTTRPTGGEAGTSGSPMAAGATTQPAAKQSDLKITLMDGSILAGKLSVNDLAIDTKFGSLKVPVDQIQSFMPGLASHPAFQQQISDYVNNLAADTFAEREKAQQALIKIGPDIRGELERLAKSAEAEKANRLQAILDDFQADNGDDDSAAPKSAGWVKDDVIVTPGFTVVGHITTTSFAVTSSYGTLNLKLEDVRQAMREGEEKEDLHKSFSVPGSNFAGHVFSNSTVRLAKGDQVFVTATGMVNLSIWNQQSSPDGNSNIGGSIATSNGAVTTGTLIGRIGDSGPTFRVGSKLTFTADRAGNLEFGIASPGDYSGNSFPGQYDMKIKVVKK